MFEAERPRLTGLAYRLLGSLADAEDVVQDAWLRWMAADRAAIVNPPAWLTTVVSRRGLDRLRQRKRPGDDPLAPAGGLSPTSLATASALAAAVLDGDVDEVLRLLDPDAVLISDGGP